MLSAYRVEQKTVVQKFTSASFEYSKNRTLDVVVSVGNKDLEMVTFLKPLRGGE